MSTKNFVPRATNEGSIGTSSKRWGAGWFGAVYDAGQRVATLLSPVFTGTPTAPTQASGDNSTRLATTAFSVAAITQAISGLVTGPAGSITARIAVFDGTTGKLLAQSTLTIAQVLDRANHTGTQLAATISDFATAAAVAAKTVKLDDLATPDNTTDLDATTGRHGLLPRLSGSATDVLLGTGDWAEITVSYTDANAVAAVAAKLGDTNSIAFSYNLTTHVITAAVRRKISGLTAGDEGEIAETTDGLAVKLGTTATTAAAGSDTRFPTQQGADRLNGTGLVLNLIGAITTLVGGTSGCLDELPTVDDTYRVNDTIFVLIPGTPNLAYIYTLQAVTTATDSPDAIRPTDYSPTTNEKVWIRWF